MYRDPRRRNVVPTRQQVLLAALIEIQMLVARAASLETIWECAEKAIEDSSDRPERGRKAA